jgi:CTP:molybdopterin cytidylyltransferase MocA
MITPILLAAGASSRMGRTKALLDIGGRTALERALAAVEGLGRPILVLGPDRIEIERRVPLRGVKIAVNPRVESGQTGSLKVGLSHLPPDAAAFLVYPVDFPLIRRADVARLVAAFEAEAGKGVFLPSYRMKRGHPLLCRRELAGEFLALAETGTARDVLNANPGRIAYVLFEEAYILMDMDTPEDYARCQEEFRKRSGS